MGELRPWHIRKSTAAAVRRRLYISHLSHPHKRRREDMGELYMLRFMKWLMINGKNWVSAIYIIWGHSGYSTKRARHYLYSGVGLEVYIYSSLVGGGQELCNYDFTSISAPRGCVEFVNCVRRECLVLQRTRPRACGFYSYIYENDCGYRNNNNKKHLKVRMLRRKVSGRSIIAHESTR